MRYPWKSARCGGEPGQARHQRRHQRLNPRPVARGVPFPHGNEAVSRQLSTFSQGFLGLRADRQ